MDALRRVLFVCTGNAARSQMAEGFLRALGRGRYVAASAGTAPAGLHPLAVRVMAEAGIDIAAQASKALAPLVDEPWDLVVTVCDAAAERCPVFPRATRRLHWSFEDPAAAAGPEAARLAVFRRVRDAIGDRVYALAMGAREVAALAAGTADGPLGPHATALGLRFVSVDVGEAVFALALSGRHLNPYGIVHGGVLYSLVDTAMGAALVTRLEPGERCVTLEIKLQHLATAGPGEGLRAAARVVQRTRRVGVLECRVDGDGGRLVGLATGTFHIGQQLGGLAGRERAPAPAGGGEPASDGPQ